MVTMTLEQAEQFFKKYDGRKFHMMREDWYHYQLYERLQIAKELEDQWRSEITAEEFEKRFDNGEDVLDYVDPDSPVVQERSSEQALLLAEE